MNAGRIETHYSLRHANLVLRELRRLWPTEWKGEVSCWSNGREQGYYITMYPPNDFKISLFLYPSCVFAQNRNGDQVVVVIGRADNFDITTNMPTDDCWESGKKYFSDNTAAAKYIVETFHEMLLAEAKG